MYEAKIEINVLEIYISYLYSNMSSTSRTLIDVHKYISVHIIKAAIQKEYVICANGVQ